MKYRSVQYGVVFISLLCIMILIISMIMYYKTVDTQYNNIRSISDSQRKELIDNALESARQRCDAVVHENSAWDELKDYVLSNKKDEDWIYENIGSMSESFNAANVAVLDSLGHLLYQNPTTNYLDVDFFSDIKFHNLLQEKLKCHFFSVINRKVYEYFCQGIVSSEDINTRLEKPVGTLVFIRELSDSLLNTYNKYLGEIKVTLSLSKNDGSLAQETNSDKFSYSLDLANQFKVPVAFMHFDSVDQTSLILKNVMSILAIFAAVVLLTFFLILIFIRLRIIIPLRKITDTFTSEDLVKIKSLKKQKTEFGVLSNYLERFILQKQKLVQLNQEMENKQQELLSQNDLLEDQKKEIENQVENANVLNMQIIERNKETERKNVQISVQNEQLAEQAKLLKSTQTHLDELDYKLNFTTNQLNSIQTQMIDSQVYSVRLRNVLMVAATPAKHILNDYFVFQMLREKVSSDFVFAKKIDKWVVTAVGNCSLSGIPGSLLSALYIYLLSEIVDFTKSSEMSPDLMLNSLNKKIISSLSDDVKAEIDRDGLHISLFIYNTETMKGYFAAAKRTMVLVREGEDTEYFGDNLSVGKITDDKQFRVIEIKLMPDDMVYLYSDGCTDVVGGPFCKKLSPLNFKKQIVSKYLYPLQAQKVDFKKFYENWLGDLELNADLTIFGFKI